MGHQLVLFIPAILAFLDLINSAVRRHDPTIGAQSAVISGPVGINDVDLPPGVAMRIRTQTIISILMLGPSAMKVFYIGELNKTAAVGANEY